MTDSPVREYRTITNDSGDPGYTNRVLVATPSTGVIRMEWHTSRSGQIIPVNWGMVQMIEFMNGYIVMNYQVADAQNMIVKKVIEHDFEWLFLIEHDNVLPPDCFIRMNDYMRRKDTPVISGLYYTRSDPSEPLVFRGRGTSYYDDWKLGDRVWCDGVPTGCLLIHGGILREMWKESEEYTVNGQTTRRVFDTPRDYWYDPEMTHANTLTGTSDLAWCTRVIEGQYFAKAGWDQYQNMRWPFLVDTNIFCTHINLDGQQYPRNYVEIQKYLSEVHRKEHAEKSNL